MSATSQEIEHGKKFNNWAFDNDGNPILTIRHAKKIGKLFLKIKEGGRLI